MSVTNPDSRVQHTANGSTVSFPFPNIIYLATELTVIGVDPTSGVPTTYVLNTDYTIDPTELGQQTGVNVVFGTAPTALVNITIARIVPNTQVLELVEGAKLPSAALEQSLDELEFQIQQINDALSRIALPPITQTIGNPLRLNNGTFVVFDASANGVPTIGVTNGNVRDSIGGTVITPTLNGIPISSFLNPTLVVGSTDTVCYRKDTINATTGAMVSSLITTGTTLPSDTSTAAYQKMSDILVTVADGVATVIPSGNIAGSQNYFYCGVLPATDGSGHLYNS